MAYYHSIRSSPHDVGYVVDSYIFSRCPTGENVNLETARIMSKKSQAALERWMSDDKKTYNEIMDKHLEWFCD